MSKVRKKWQSCDVSKGKIADYKPFNFVDGEGVRSSIYVSGCVFNCKGCYNKAIQNFNLGFDYTKELENQIIADLDHDYVQGLTLLGGEPFLNTGTTLALSKRVREVFGDEKDIWAWTGYTWEELAEETEDKQELLSYVDILIDGLFELDKRDLNLQFRGSSNQRIIDVKKSKALGKVVLWDKAIN